MQVHTHAKQYSEWTVLLAISLLLVTLSFKNFRRQYFNELPIYNFQAGSHFTAKSSAGYPNSLAFHYFDVDWPEGWLEISIISINSALPVKCYKKSETNGTNCFQLPRFWVKLKLSAYAITQPFMLWRFTQLAADNSWPIKAAVVSWLLAGPLEV